MTAAGDGFRVEPGQLDGVADRITGAVAAVERARPSGEQLSGDAFGLVGGFFAGAAISAMGTGAGAVDGLCRCLHEAADELRAAVRGYEHTDLDAARSFLGVEVPEYSGGVGGAGPGAGP